MPIMVRKSPSRSNPAVATGLAPGTATSVRIHT